MGKPFISHQIDLLSKISDEIFIVANSKIQVKNYIDTIDISNILAFIIDDTELVQDPNFRNPILGLYSTFKELNKLHYEKVFVISCDNPIIQPKVIQLMVKECFKYDCCIPKWDNGFLEPLFALYPVELALNTAKRNILQNKLKLTDILNISWRINYISIEKSIKEVDPNLLSFYNLNNKTQIDQLEKELNKIKKKK